MHTLDAFKQQTPLQRSGARVLMLAAENGAIPGAKVGGMADVLNDIPLALAELDIAVDIAMPSFGQLVASANAHWTADIDVEFAGTRQRVGIYRAQNPNLTNSYFYLFEHALFNGTHGAYSQGDAQRPFADDATKFALFNLAVAEALTSDIVHNNDTPYFSEPPSHLHLHDWHTGLFAMLRAFDSRYEVLQDLPCVFSIHNLALQGIRPFTGDSSSFATWFPQLSAALNDDQLSLIRDPRYPNCINPMRAGIVLSERVHLVSPSYALEVLKPSKPQQGFFGGEGLEQDLQHKLDQNALVGILNGCMYPAKIEQSAERESQLNPQSQLKPSQESGIQERGVQEIQENCAELTCDLIEYALDKLVAWQAGKTQVRSQDFIAQSRLYQWQTRLQKQALAKQLAVKEPVIKDALSKDSLRKVSHDMPFILSSVGRLTNQKVLILRHRFGLSEPDPSLRGKTVLAALLEQLTAYSTNARFVMLGSGDKEIAREFTDIAAKHKQFIFLDGYDEPLSDKLYHLGSLFLMPSSFEPCGISQMLAMRAGQLCLVNRIGGLKDTVHHMETGFVFEGEDIEQQAKSLLSTFDDAMAMVGSERWLQMQQSAQAVRFDWLSQAKRYKSLLYGL